MPGSHRLHELMPLNPARTLLCWQLQLLVGAQTHTHMHMHTRTRTQCKLTCHWLMAASASLCDSAAVLGCMTSAMARTGLRHGITQLLSAQEDYVAS